MIKDLVQTDITYSSSTLFFFTILEPLLGIVLACLPVLRPAMTQIGSVFTGTRKSLIAESGYGSGGKSHANTIGSNGKYSNIDRSDSLTRPINTSDDYAMDAIEQGKGQDQSQIRVTTTYNVKN